MSAVIEDVKHFTTDPAGQSAPGTKPTGALRAVKAAMETQTLFGGRRIRVARGKAHREPMLVSSQEKPGRPMDRRSSEADVALEAWARWARSALAGLGWAPRTLLARVIEYGAFGAAARGGLGVIEADEFCELVERAVMRLKAIERKVVVSHYLHWQSIEVSARYCGMSKGRFRTLLSAARRSVGDYLEGAKLLFEQIPP